jgi:hypothetical protein
VNGDHSTPTQINKGDRESNQSQTLIYKFNLHRQILDTKGGDVNYKGTRTRIISAERNKRERISLTPVCPTEHSDK